MLDPSRIRVTGPLGDHAEGFRSVLAGLGYSPRTLWDQTYVLARLGRWLVIEGLAPAELTPDVVDRFVEVRRAAGHRRWASRRSLAPMLNHLEQIGVIPSQRRPDPSGPVEDLLTDCRRYLLVERGLAATTVRSAIDVARRFLTRHLVRGELDVTGLQPADVTGFILGEGRHRSVGAMKVMVTSLRSFLRFLFVTARTSRDLTTAVPAIAGWSVAGLPKGIDAATFTALLNSCDQRGQVGLRDRAILTLMGRLGLRAAEVAALQLDDIAWRAGEMVIHGKGGRVDRLPIPEDVGETLARYLRHGRGRAACRAVFLRAFAPRGPMTGRSVVMVPRSAATRAGLPMVGAHQLRHTAACQMLNGGASLGEIAQVLRHHSERTTALYAKVDRSALDLVIRPWPGVA